MLYQRQQFDLAEPYYRRALDIRKKMLGNDHPETAIALNNLANDLRSAGKKLDEAEICYQEAVRIRTATIGPNHISTGFTLSGYGRLMRMKGDANKAIELLERAYDICITVRGAQHRDTLPTAIELAELYLERGDHERAQHVIERSFIGLDTAPLAADTRARIEQAMAAAMQPA
jgi:tetratricopeptide (TPR) repeat protein